MDKNVVKTEKLSRCGLRESYGVTYMLEMLSERLKEALKQGSAWDASSELKLTQEWLELVMVTSFRTSAFLQSIQVLSKDLTRVTSTIGPGQYFGEVGLIFGDYRTATVRAAFPVAMNWSAWSLSVVATF